MHVQVPVDRALTFPTASNLYRDAEELLRNLHVAPFAKPQASIIDDFPMHQGHKGWQFGYLAGNSSGAPGKVMCLSGHVRTPVTCAAVLRIFHVRMRMPYHSNKYHRWQQHAASKPV